MSPWYTIVTIVYGDGEDLLLGAIYYYACSVTINRCTPRALVVFGVFARAILRGTGDFNPSSGGSQGIEPVQSLLSDYTHIVVAYWGNFLDFGGGVR